MLQIALKGSKLLQMARNDSKWTLMAQIAPNYWKWLEIAPNDSKGLQIAPNVYKWHQMAPNCFHKSLLISIGGVCQIKFTLAVKNIGLVIQRYIKKLLNSSASDPLHQ